MSTLRKQYLLLATLLCSIAVAIGYLISWEAAMPFFVGAGMLVQMGILEI